MKQIFLLFCFSIFIINIVISQQVFRDDFSTFNIAKLDGQNSWSTSTPPLGNGTGGCFGVSCIYVGVVSKIMSYPNFGSCTQAINPVDGTLATQDGPGKSLGTAINSGSIYASFLINLNPPLASPTGNKQLVRLMDNSFTSATRIWIKQISSGGAFQVGIDKNGSSTIYSTASFSYGQDHLLVIKYEFNSNSATDDIASLYVDPDISQNEPSATVSATGTADASSITRIAFPWNSSTAITNGYVGIVEVSKNWGIIPSTSTISGAYRYPSGKLIPKVKMSIVGSTIYSTVSSDSFSAILPNNGNYNLHPSKNNDVVKNNGVSAIDIILTQNHIVNKTPFTNPYKIIAADVNNDKKVSAIDIIFMKRLILGVDTTFTGNRLWTFVDSAYSFPIPSNPFPYKDSISYTGLSATQNNQTFIGLKLGDVDFNWNPAIAKPVKASNTQVELYYNELNLKGFRNLSGLIRIPIRVKNFKDLLGMQYTLNFNNDAYEYVGIEKNLLKMDFNDKRLTKNDGQGSISFLWADANGNYKTLEDGTVLFELLLKAKSGDRNPKLEISSDITSIEAIDKNLIKHDIILTTNHQTLTTNNLFTVSPNPTTGLANVNLVSNADKPIHFELRNADGKLMMQQSVDILKGENNITINLKQKQSLPAGIYYLKKIGLEGEETKRIMIQ